MCGTVGDALSLDVGKTFYDALTKKISNVVDGVAAQDVATKAQVDAVSIGAGDLPTVGGGDNDKSLYVVAGVWATQTIVQAQALLNLPADADSDITTLQSDVTTAEADIVALKKLQEVAVIEFTTTNTATPGDILQTVSAGWEESNLSKIVPTIQKRTAAATTI